MTTLLQTLINNVYTETNRPDLVAETLQAVLEATQSCHFSDFYTFDIVEAQVMFIKPAFIQQLDTTTIPYFRAANFIRKTTSQTYLLEQNPNQCPAWQEYPNTTAFDFLTKVELSDIIDSYGYEKVDIYYQAGTQINIKSSTALQYCLLGYYTQPVLDPTGVAYSSWIANNLPYAIVYKAAGSIFAKIGEDKSYGIYMRPPNPGNPMDKGGMFYEQLGLLKRYSVDNAF